MKILYLSNIPSPYRVEYFNQLGKQCELTVIFEKNSSDERDASWSEYKFQYFKGIILQGIKIRTDTAICPQVIKYLTNEKYDHIIVTNFSSPTGLIAIAWMKRKKIIYSVEADGAFKNEKKGVKEKIKSWAISSAELCFSTSNALDDYFIKYGAKRQQIRRYPFSSVCQERLLKNPPSREQKDFLKTKLNISESNIIITVGAFIPRKGFDILLRAIPNIKKNEEWGIYIIGGKITSEYADIIKKEKIKNVHFVEFCRKNELSDFYQMADLFVLPTREDIWGLVINEALANALPVITTDRCVAGVELIKNNYNGLIVKADDTEDLVKGINELISRKSEWEKMSFNSLRTAKKYTIEEMVQSHMKVWNNTSM